MTNFRKSPRRWAGVFIATAMAALTAASPSPTEVVLTGPLEMDRILEALPDLARAAQAYEPNFRAIDGIHDFAKSARIKVFLGTWDANGKAPVAAFIKTIEMAFNPAIEIEWIGVSRNLKDPAEALRAYGVDKVPMFIVWVDGKEKGRIVESPEYTLEEDLASVLLGVPFSDVDMDIFRSRPHSHLPIDCAPCHGPKRPGRAQPSFR
ncbi:MAG: hypothetical protein NTW38_09730 [Candidatus Aminicenantes bacterium]|nr:hypothetical protein [Candidatus Aminicenantes bacterium]